MCPKLGKELRTRRRKDRNPDLNDLIGVAENQVITQYSDKCHVYNIRVLREF